MHCMLFLFGGLCRFNDLTGSDGVALLQRGQGLVDKVKLLIRGNLGRFLKVTCGILNLAMLQGVRGIVQVFSGTGQVDRFAVLPGA